MNYFNYIIRDKLLNNIGRTGLFIFSGCRSSMWDKNIRSYRTNTNLKIKI